VYQAFDSSATLLRTNGEPTFKETAFGNERWVYATRSFSPKGWVPAAVLRIEFDPAGLVSDWYFLDPQSHQQLPIRETVAEAARRFGQPRIFCAAAPIPVIDLESGLRKHVATRKTAADLFSPLWTPRERSRESAVVWELSADRPSAAFVPPKHWVYDVAPNGKIVSFGVQNARGGCE
jgi:hypothetical protein